ncbi:hypothetical protein J2T50_000987 [Streptococcus gallinaceus]|uniref:hypothetical protein n=1 Tax=Streptococcus gallinaceus TaxID=165758 RepID=UPI0020A18AB1|nr:hypothetical protein [Streptococcus gallinaceus]MCP1639290.1 hypothetical protein [Streptococcus gallinaceus]MCP1770066.1 hypothetical protein [Streptococcus gallinaceus]
MEFKLKMHLTQEEQDYINGVVGYPLVEERDYLVYSEADKIYRLIFQSQNSNPDRCQNAIDIMIYKDSLVKLTYRAHSRNDYEEVTFFAIVAPTKLKNEEEKVIKMIKATQARMAAARDGDPDKMVMIYPNGIHITYSDDRLIPIK